MPRIPSYIRAEVFDIDDEDIILGEDIRGSGKTMTYTFGVLKDYFGVNKVTGVESVNGFTGVVNLVTSDIDVVSDYNYVTDNQLEVLSRFKIDGENMNLWDADEHTMVFVGRDATNEVGLDMLNPLRFDIQVPSSVPDGKATFTLQEDQTDALSFIAKDYRMMRLVTTTDEEKVELWKPTHLKEVNIGDDTMDALVIDPSSGEIKTFDIGGNSGTTQYDITTNISVGGINSGTLIPSGTDLTAFIEDLLVTTYDPTKTDNYVVLNGVTSSTMEVGTPYGTTLSTFYYAGTIVSADGSPTIDLTGAATTATYSGSGVNPSTGVVSTSIALGSNSWGVVQDYNAGTGSYYDSDSVESHIFDAYRVAGSVIDTSNVITGKYYLWYSAGTIETTSAGVRALPDRMFYPVSTFDIAIPAGTQPVSFYLPNGFSSVTVLYVESSNADVTSTFAQVAMNVNDGGGTPVGYTRFETTIPGVGYTEDATYRVNIT